MTAAAAPAPWGELLELLAPVHEPARLFARRIAGSRSDGDDLFQEALLRAARKLDTLRERERFRPWFFRLVIALHRSRARRAFWRRLVALDRDEGAAATRAVGDAGEHWDQHLGAARAAAALAVLPAVQREAIVLYELHGHTVQEIAEFQRATPSAVKTRLARGRERLRRHYDAEGATFGLASTPPTGAARQEGIPR